MRKMRVGLVVAMVVLFGFGLQSAIADTEVSGDITSDSTWGLAGSPYIVVGDVTVDSGVTLTIEPGVSVKFNSHLSLNIHGELIAKGTATDSIMFTSNNPLPQPGDWGGIRFYNNSVDAVVDSLDNYVSGCILEYCRIEYGGWSSTSVGGIVYSYYASPFISHNTITENSVSNFGGGIHCSWESFSVIINNTIISNSATRGGGISCYGSSPSIVGNKILGNSASYGGGIYCYESSATIFNNTITGDSASSKGGGIYCENWSAPVIEGNIITGNNGGGIYCVDHSSPTIINNTITENASDDGSGIYCGEWCSPEINGNIIQQNSTATWGTGGGVLANGYYSYPVITDNTVTGNSATWGGGIACCASSATIRNNIITGNSASNYAGGVYCTGGAPTIAGNVIAGNSGGYGAGIYCKDSSNPNIIGNTITGNSGGDGAGIYCVNHSSPIVTGNSIIRNFAYRYGGGIYCSESSSPVITDNNIVENSASYRGSGIYCYDSSCPRINYNNLVNEGEYEIYLDNVSDSVNAINNWWGTINPDSIDAKIHDYYEVVTFIPFLTSPAVGEPDTVYSVALKSDETYTSDLTTDLWVGTRMYIQLEGQDSDSICVDQTTVTVASDSTDTLGIVVALTETDSISGIFRGTVLIDSVSVEGVSIGATVGETIIITSGVDSTKFTTVGVVEVRVKEGPNLRTPKTFSLSQNFPNPFNPTTEIRYALPRDARVRLEIYNLLGRKVATLVNEYQRAGYRSVRWNAKGLASGVYLYRLKAGNFRAVKKLVVIK